MKYEVFGSCLIGFKYEVEANSEEEAIEIAQEHNNKDVFLGDMMSCEAEQVSTHIALEHAVKVK